jgi:hypothetical protein
MYIIYHDHEVEVNGRPGYGQKKSVDRRYWSIDGNSGYPYWSHMIESAKHFGNFDEAHDLIRGKEFTVRSGRYPATMLHGALGLCNTKIVGTVTICVGEIVIKTVDSITYKDCIQVPTLRETALAKLTDDEKKALGL